MSNDNFWEGYVPEPIGAVGSSIKSESPLGCNGPAQQALDKKAENARELGLDYEPAQPRAWFTIDELNAWADKKLKENPQWAEQPAQPEFITHSVDQPYDWSEWVCPDPKSYLFKCCDCGLVHEAEFGVVRYKSDTEREDCDMVDDPNLQAVFRMRRSEQWSPADMAHRAGGLTMEQPAQEPKRWAVFCGSCRKEWSVSYPHPGKSICADCDDKLAERKPFAWADTDDVCADTAFRWVETGDHKTPVYTSPPAQQEPVAVPTTPYEHRKFVLVGRKWYERFAAFHDDCQIGERLTREEQTVRQQGYENGWNDAQRYLREPQASPPTQPQQEPVAWIDMSQWPPIRWRDGMLRKDVDQFDGQGLYTSPPAQRKPLTDEEIHAIYDEVARQEPYSGAVTRRNIARAIEAKHNIKENT